MYALGRQLRLARQVYPLLWGLLPPAMGAACSTKAAQRCSRGRTGGVRLPSLYTAEPQCPPLYYLPSKRGRCLGFRPEASRWVFDPI